MLPYIRRTDAKVRNNDSFRTSGGRDPASNRMLASWQSIAPAVFAVFQNYAQSR